MRIADRKHRVIVCSQREDVLDGELLVQRVGAIKGWAAIEPVKANRFSRDGQVISNRTMEPTHEITMNYNPDVTLSLSAWVYEHRLKSPPRWFKIISVTNVDECSQYMKMKCRMTEATDEAIEPAEPVKEKTNFGAMDLPDGINL